RTASAQVTGAGPTGVLGRQHQTGRLRETNYLQPCVQEILDRFTGALISAGGALQRLLLLRK
ncbi:hypothetical protein, partial [Steroidobacter gossypii]|uniref:hypothetical protein n=1 Tax=Steroidobacter gossypii TaxID=2805490 RepID=UPI001C3FA555